jgi:hypothetical protein
MNLSFPVLETWTWPWPAWTLNLAYLASGIVMAIQYLPQLRRAWLHPAATRDAQSLSTWTVWTLCRAIALVYGVYILHDLMFLIVVGADVGGRLAMVALILRAHKIAPLEPEAKPVPRRRATDVNSLGAIWKLLNKPIGAQRKSNDSTRKPNRQVPAAPREPTVAKAPNRVQTSPQVPRRVVVSPQTARTG